ncbi:uncharacterized protein LOC107610454 [Arachis ipaensis]|uniref:uncharacterized protein LOC107610454 n=1 Tax=Arachis ipaensis TaxID=130454 RepID=UPI0007AEF2D7|nr:uncharacterized protein LOC107610454 [Arachis ipaensis]
MGYFKVKVYHGGWFTYKNGPLEYMGGETTVIEEIDGDWWSVFEAYAELKQLGYVEENIPSLWFKDLADEDMEKNLKLFKTDADSIDMCRIAELRDHVELYVVHKVQDEEVFPDAGYIDVREKDGMGDISEGQELVLYGGVDEGQNQSEPVAAYSGAEDDNEVEYGNSSDSDSLDSEYKPSGEEDDSEDDVHFTDSDDELDPEGRNEDFEDDEGENSDDLEEDHQVGADGFDSEHDGLRFPVHKLQKDMGQYKWEVGTVYASREEFKDTVIAYVVHTARAIRFRKCDLQRVRAVCSGDCPFWVYAAKIRGWGFYIRSGGKAFKKKVEANLKVKIRELVSKAQKKWNLTVTKSLASKTKQIALDQIQRTFREQYKRIYDYGQELMRANPGSSVRIQVQRSPDLDIEAPASSRTSYCIFQRIYVCLEACKQSFQHCRDFIGLDGCFLKTPLGGQLLTAIGWDSNDQILPIAYAVVEAETKDSWTWFLSHLASDVGLEKMGRATFMSDQQKGLLPAYEEVITGVDNRLCVRHLYNNFRKRFPGLQLKKLMWKCAKEAYRYLIAIPPRYWSRSMFTYNSKVDTLVNNMFESFNSTIVDAREKPIVTMLEKIRVKLMTRWAENRKLAQNYSGTILPRIRLRLEKRSRSAGEWRPYWSTAQKYEVVNGLDKFAVDLGSHECSCRMWKMSGIPCVHAISCIKFKGLDLEPFVDGCYKKEAYMRCYDSIIQPLNGVDLWERTAHPDVMPSPIEGLVTGQ